jgi:hypothetical protein
MNMFTEHRWNDTDRGKLKYWRENMSHSHYVHHKHHGEWPGIAPNFRGERPMAEICAIGMALAELISGEECTKIIVYLTENTVSVL